MATKKVQEQASATTELAMESTTLARGASVRRSARAWVPPSSACPRLAPPPRPPRCRHRRRKPRPRRWRSSPRATPGSVTREKRRRQISATRSAPQRMPQARSRRPRVVARPAPARRAFVAPRAPVASIATLAPVVVRIGKANSRESCFELLLDEAPERGGGITSLNVTEEQDRTARQRGRSQPAALRARLSALRRFVQATQLREALADRNL